MTLYIPKELDLEQLEQEKKPENYIESYKKDHLAYILHLFSHLPGTKKGYLYDDGLIPLSTEILQDRIKKYHQYLEFLQKEGIIQSNNSYVVGVNARKFRLAYELRLGVKPYIVTDKCFLKNLHKFQLRHIGEPFVKRYPHLERYFNDKLQMNEDVALDYINHDYYLKSHYPHLRDEKWKDGRMKKKSPVLQFNSSMIHLENFKSGNIGNFTVDRNGHRFHSPLTYMNSTLRHTLTYDGQSLVSLDIKNSQPYFSTLLFTEGFWEKKMEENNYKSIYSDIINDNHTDSLIMLSIFENIITKPDVLKYKELVISGKFYDQFALEYNSKYNESKTRSDVKEDMFTILFSDNKYFTRGKSLFRQLYPNVYEVFRLIKKTHKNKLAILLQRIESEAVLDGVIEVLVHERPRMPVWTIHDSIITTEENAGYLKELMEKVLTSILGVAPVLQEEKWALESVYLELDALELKI